MDNRQAIEEQLRSSEVMVVVGCGGVCFHALSGMRCEQAMRSGGAAFTLFVDGDRVEERNAERQAWGRTLAGKAARAGMLWEAMEGGGTAIVPQMLTRETANAVWDNVSGVRRIEEVGRIVVVCLPDNDECRREAARLAVRVSATRREADVWYVVAGTGEDADGGEGGQAWGYKLWGGVWWEGGEHMTDGSPMWMARHKDMWDEEGEGRGPACQANVEQSLVGNMETAVCVVEVLRAMRPKKGPGFVEAMEYEVYWKRPLAAAGCGVVTRWVEYKSGRHVD